MKDEDLDRRASLEKMGKVGGAAALGLSGLLPAPRAGAQSPTPGAGLNPNPPGVSGPGTLGPTAPVPALTNPNILPNIFGQIRDNAVVFDHFFAAATACTPSRSTFVTGLYTPQTGQYLTETDGSVPVLDTRYWTYGNGLPQLNSAYNDNVWWFGKWHLSLLSSGGSLLDYGFRTKTYPDASNPSPNGDANEGTDGGDFGTPPVYFAKDHDISEDFAGWIGTPPTNHCCATVSLINPHDLSFYPAWLLSSTIPPGGAIPTPGVYFSQASGESDPGSYLVSSAPPNYESPSALAAKNIQLQQMYLANENHAYGTVGTFAGSNFVDLQNWYYYLQHYVDTEVGNVLTALQGSTFADNTIVIFTSDHGEYGGSHGLHGKGGAVYDESLRVPLYVMFPGGANTARYQMCSAVDFFKLICELGTGGPTSSFSTNFPDQANRQSIYSFIYSNATETRLGPSGLDNAPYILHTVDEASATEDGNGVYSDSSTTPLKNHVLCLRTKTLESSPDTGAKYAVYSHWALCSTVPASTTPDYEFYDYTNLDNPGELGNNYSSTNPATVALLAAFQAALGPWSGGTPGLIQTELNPALTGTGSDGTTALSTVQSEALIAYKNYIATMLYGEGSDYCGTP